LTSPEEFLSRNIILYAFVGLALRFVLYGLPRIDLVWLYALLSLLVGFGGGGIAWGNRLKLTRITVIGIILIIIGLLPLHILL